MKSNALWALIALNAVLLASFVWRVLPDNSAVAQQAGAARRVGDYLVLPAQVNGSSSGIVIVLDQTNGQLSALSFDESTNRFDSMPKIDLKRVFSAPVQAPRGGARPGY
jgi:hypothetical protein